MSGLTFERVVRPEPALLEELAGYDAEAFGETGLRSFDLGVVARVGGVYLVREGGAIAGSCQLLRMLDAPEMFWVFGFYVRPGWRGRGLGRHLLEYAAAQVQAAGGEGLALSVSPANVVAINLYLSFGFRVVEEVADFYGPGEDRYVMEWRTDRTRNG